MIRNIGLILSANTSAFGPKVAQAQAQVQKLSAAVAASSTTANKAKVAMGALAAVVGVALIAAYAAGVHSSIAFEKEMRNVATVSEVTRASFADISNEVLDLSRTFPQSAATLAAGLYDIASSGFDGSEALTILTASAKAATAGLTTTEVAAKGVAAVLNAYGLAGSEAERVSDILFQTVNLGVVTFEQLAGSIGDVVGIGAAANISIGQLGAAVAAMTLSGVSAEESTTSLNRLIQSLIDPTDELAQLYNALGIDILPALADEGVGLHGVMEQIRVATGGNVATLLTLFGEIRAVRGAFALGADEGRNYARTVEGIANATNVAGATQRAFDEQVKTTSASWARLQGDLSATAISVTTKTLPAISGLIEAIHAGGQVALPALGRAALAVRPAFGALIAIGGDVVSMLAAAADGVSLLVRVLATVGGGAVVAALNTTASALAGLTGFMADHPNLVKGVAVAYAVSLVPALIGTATAFGHMALGAVVRGLASVAAAAEIAAMQFRTLTGAAAGLAGIAAVVTIVALGRELQKSSEAADELAASMTHALDIQTSAGTEEALRRTRAALAELSDEAKGSGLFDNLLSLDFGFGLQEMEAKRAKDAVAALSAEEVELNRTSIQLAENTAAVTNATGLSRNAVEALAKALGVDLTQGFKDSEEGRRKLIDHFKETARVLPEVAEAARDGVIDFEQLAAVTEAASEAAEQVGKSFSKATDLISAYGKATDEYASAADAVESAQKGVTAAERGLAEIRTRQAGKDSQSVSDTQALVRAQDNLADAHGRLAEAQAALGAAAPENVFARTLKEAQEFATGIQVAAERGLDPQMIARLLEAGPAQAAPLLRAIASDHSGQLVELVNQTEAQLREINTRVVEFARLTQQAVMSGTDERVLALGTAMAIAAGKMDNLTDGVANTAAQLATQLGESESEIRRVADLFGISLSPAISALGDFAVESDAVKDSLDGLASKIIDNGLDFDDNTIAAATNRLVLKDVADAIRAHIDALRDEGAETEVLRDTLSGHVDDLREVLRATGLTEAAIDELIVTYGLVPREIRTDVTVRTEEAEASIARLLRLQQGFGDMLSDTFGATPIFPKAVSGAQGPVPLAPISVAAREEPSGVEADGGVLRFYARGGIRNEGHVAQIAATGTTRIWNEPETGGEAYIPLAPAKRGRSSQVLKVVADRFGLTILDRTDRERIIESMVSDGSPVQSFANGGVSEQLGGLIERRETERIMGTTVREPAAPRIDIDYERFASVVAEAMDHAGSVVQLQVNYPTPEPASTALPRAAQQAATRLRGRR